MYRVTTPTYTFNIPFDADDIDELKLTFRQQSKALTFEKSDVELTDKKIVITLTQEQTKEFRSVPCEVQLRVKLVGGSVVASNMIRINIKPVLNEEIL